MKHGETLVAEKSGGIACQTVSNFEGNRNLLSHTHCEMKIRRNIERYMNRVDKDVMKHLFFITQTRWPIEPSVTPKHSET